MSFFYMMDDLRYLFSLFSFFFSFFYGGGGGWSSSRWLFGTQLGCGHAVGLAVERKRAAQQGCTRFGKANPVPPLQAVGGFSLN